MQQRGLQVHERNRRVDTHSATLLLPAFERIIELAELPSNWNLEDATPPTNRAVAAACYLILAAAAQQERLDRVTIGPITSSPIPDGGLQIEWQGGNARIDVQANHDGSYGYLVKWGEGGLARYEEADEAPIETVLALIARVLAD